MCILRAFVPVVFLFIFGVVPAAQAYDVIPYTVAETYDVFKINDNPPIQQLFIGTLNGAPQIYEITSDKNFLLSIQIRALSGKHAVLPNLNGIIVRQKVRDVEEIVRLQPRNSTWPSVRDVTTGLRYRAGTLYSTNVPAGTYHIEVSTPNNQGKYILMVGSQPQSIWYFTTLANVATMYRFYNLPLIFIIRSPIVYYPLGSLILVGLIFATWRWQRKQKNT